MNTEQEEKQNQLPTESVNPTEISPEMLEETKHKIDSLFADGMKQKRIHANELAADLLGEANTLSVKVYGHFSPKCFLTHLHYGKVLLDLAQSEVQPVAVPAGVKDSAEDSSDEEVTADEEENITKRNAIDGAGETKNTAETVEAEKVGAEKPEMAKSMDTLDSETTEESKTDEKSQESAEVEIGDNEMNVECDDADSTIPQPADETLIEEEEGVQPEDGQMEGDEGDLTNLRLAWESLEVARKICEMQDETPEWLEKKADTLVALGECQACDEKFEEALEEFGAALDILKKIFEPYDRRISEIYYQMGITYKNMNDFHKAAESFEQAEKIFGQFIDHKEKLLEMENGESTKEALMEEVISLKKIYDDIQEQVQDARDSAVAREKQLEKAKELLSVLNILPQNSNANQEADDITNLVRKAKKRPATEEKSAEAGNTTKQEKGSPGAENVPIEKSAVKKSKLDGEDVVTEAE